MRLNAWQRVVFVIWAIAGGIWCSASVAQTSKDYALMGRKAWAAFSCSALASVAGKADEQQRLFTLGYEQGKTFIEALRSGKIEKKDVDAEVPVGVLWVLQGPSADFALGRMWETAVQEATKDVYATSAKGIDDQKFQALAASNAFTKANCSLM
jgi:hypothetical protein